MIIVLGIIATIITIFIIATILGIIKISAYQDNEEKGNK